jgi:hypothetical protein
MLRVAFAGVLGAALAVAAAFLLVALSCALAGSPNPHTGRIVYGWQAAREGALFHFDFGSVQLWPALTVLAVGFGAGVGAELALQQREALV